MPALCRSCAQRMDVRVPSLRVAHVPCSSCGGYDPGQDKNYSVLAMLIPGSAEDPNRQAEQEERRSA